jgi:glycosyltransferase involved in cell wall biosynthesis
MKKGINRILFVHHGSGIGGAPISLLNLIKNLDREKYYPIVLFIQKSDVLDFFLKEGIEVLLIEKPFTNWFAHNNSNQVKWYRILRYVRILIEWNLVARKHARDTLKKIDFDIIHLNSHVLTSWAFAAKRLNKKVVMHNREAVVKGYFGLRLGILRLLISNNCDYIINISSDNLKRLGIYNKSSVVYNFVNLPQNYRLPFQQEEIKILYLGGSYYIKGFDVMCAAAELLKEDENIRFYFAGNFINNNVPNSTTGKILFYIKYILYSRDLKLLSKLLELPNSELLGLLKNPLDYLDMCDILITPFNVQHFSRPAIEAFSYGKPVIGSNVEGMDEIIDHMKNGLLFERANSKDLVEKIMMLKMNPELGQELGRNARLKSESVFSPDVNTRKVEYIYELILREQN